MASPLTVTVATGLVRQFQTPQTLLRQFFPEVGVDAEVVTWDTFPNTREFAVYTQRGNAAVRQSRRPLSHNSYLMPRIRVDRVVQAKARYDRRPGGNQNETYGLDQQVRDELEDLNLSVEYSKERERAAVIFGGILTLSYGDGTFTNVDYATSYSNHVQQTVTSGWAASGKDVMADIESMSYAVRADAGYTPRYLLVGAGTMGQLINNTTIQNYIKEGPAGMNAIQNGKVTRLAGYDVIEHLGLYTDGGTVTPFIPANYVALLGEPADMGTMMVQGPAEEITAPGPGRFSKTYEQEDPSGITIVIEDKSGPVIQVPKAIAILKTAL